MPLVTTTEMFKKAYAGGYAVGAFNVNNMEIIQGITEAAKEENAPLILQVSKGARNYANPIYLRKMCIRDSSKSPPGFLGRIDFLHIRIFSNISGIFSAPSSRTLPRREIAAQERVSVPLIPVSAI